MPTLLVALIASMVLGGRAQGQIISPTRDGAQPLIADRDAGGERRGAERDVSPAAASEMFNEQIERIGHFRVRDAYAWAQRNIRGVTWVTAGVVLFLLLAGGVIRPGSFKKLGARDVKVFPSPIWLAIALTLLLAQHLAIDSIERMPMFAPDAVPEAPAGSGEAFADAGDEVDAGADPTGAPVATDSDPVRRRAIVMAGAYTVTVIVGLMLVYLMRKSKGGPESGLRMSSFDLMRGIGCILVALPIILALGMAADEIQRAMTGERAPRIAHQTLAEIIETRHSPWIWLTIAAVVIGAPIVEELIFRVGLQSAILRAFRSSWIAIVLTSIAFTGAHIWMLPDSAWHAYAQLFALSLAIGIAFERTRRVGTAIAMHMVFNALTIIVAMSIADIPQGVEADEAQPAGIETTASGGGPAPPSGQSGR